MLHSYYLPSSSYSDRVRLVLSQLVLKGSLVLSFDSSAVLDVSGLALLTMLIHAEMVQPTDIYQFLNLTSLAVRNCSPVVAPTIIDSEPNPVIASAADSAPDVSGNDNNSTGVLHKQLPSIVTQDDGLNVTSDIDTQEAGFNVTSGIATQEAGLNATSGLAALSDSSAFWSDVWFFLSSCWEVLASVLHQLGQILMDPQPSAPFAVVALTTILCLLVFLYLFWRLIRNLYRLMKWLCCLCRPLVPDDLPPPSPQPSANPSPQPSANPDLELANLDRALGVLDQEQPPFAMDLQVEVGPTPGPASTPAPLAMSEDFQYVPAPPAPPPPSPSKSFVTTSV